MINIENVYITLNNFNDEDKPIEKIVTLGDENKLKVGDVVWVKGTVIDVDNELNVGDEDMYEVKFKNDDMPVWLNKNIIFEKEEER